jgi:hypothetical protein
MEMLVTLGLFAVVSGLVWQALGSLARLETRMADSRLFVTQEALHSEWLRQALRGLMTGAQGDPFRFAGKVNRLQGFTAMPPWPRSAGPEPMELEILTTDGEETKLSARRPGRPTWEWTLWQWPGPGAFAYLDHKGQWHDQWPPPLGQWPTLPAAVRLNGPAGGMVLVTIPAGDNPMLRRADVEAP